MLLIGPCSEVLMSCRLKGRTDSCSCCAVKKGCRFSLVRGERPLPALQYKAGSRKGLELRLLARQQ